MKRGKLIAGTCAICLMLLTGCGGRDENASSEDVIVESVGTNDQADDESKFTDQLCGEVRTINPTEKFVIISKMFTEDGADGGKMAAIPVEGSSDEELITVYFTSEAEYILETGKADGTDVSQTKVSFSDIAEGDELNLTGMFDIRGEEFLASDVKIIRVTD